jgi:hypothetical protein
MGALAYDEAIRRAAEIIRVWEGEDEWSGVPAAREIFAIYQEARTDKAIGSSSSCKATKSRAACSISSIE